MKNANAECFWKDRYKQGKTEWDMGHISPPIKQYIDSRLINANKDLSILIAGVGNAYEAEYLHKLGFKHVIVVDFVKAPLENFAQKVPSL